MSASPSRLAASSAAPSAASRGGRKSPKPSGLAAALILGGLAVIVAPSLAGGCAQQPTLVSVRSLEQSGRVSFVCIDTPGPGATHVPRPIDECSLAQVLEINQYDLDAGVDDAGVSTSHIPHLYALVTQTTRGEVAVIDVTSANHSVLDQDPSVPGANFLPVGSQPIDIVSTPEGLATFVGVAEIGREALFALPSDRILPRATELDADARPPTPAPELSSWPACRLPSAPGQMLLLRDPLGSDGNPRESCDGAFAEPTGAHPHGDLSKDGLGNLLGRQKLVVAMPDDGGIAVFDAQKLLDLEGDAVFGPCPIERWIPLDADVPPLTLPAPPPEKEACKNPLPVTPKPEANLTARPSGLTYADGRLYVSDLAAPLIHVIEMRTPCEPVEAPPLLPFAAAEPERVVTTTRVAVSPSLTPDLKRYLYAVDADDGSAMVFDVSDTSASRLPLHRRHAEWNPFTPPDRIRFDTPVADLVVLQRDLPKAFPPTGVTAEGVRCDPDPSLTVCKPESTQCDFATAYRTSAAYDLGAGPQNLRGVFAFLALTSGKLAVIDIDDYDAPCRVPKGLSVVAGCCKDDSSAACEPQCDSLHKCPDGFLCASGFCAPKSAGSCASPSVCLDVPPDDADPDTQGVCDACSLISSNELSCNVVMPNTPRMSTYDVGGVVTGQREPGVQNFPLLYDKTGSLLDIGSDPSVPRMVATLPAQGGAISVAVGDQNAIIAQDGTFTQADGPKNILAMNLEDPRVQLVDQSWTVTFEGALPGFAEIRGALKFDAAVSDGLASITNADGRFCDKGVQSEQALLEAGVSPAGVNYAGDYIQLAATLPIEEDAYWDAPLGSGATPVGSCTFELCELTFGDVDGPKAGRDFVITEAYQDHVALRSRDLSALQDQLKALESASAPDPGKIDATKQAIQQALERPALAHCCFPSEMSFNVRVGNQWAVNGDGSGFFHHVIADPMTGACRESCDPQRARLNGRVPSVDPSIVANEAVSSAIHDGSPLAFINPMFRFAVINGTALTDQGVRYPVSPQRDAQFRFITQGAFVPLLIGVAADVNMLIQPVGIAVIPTLSKDIAVTDGSFNGLTVVSLSSVAPVRQFF